MSKFDPNKIPYTEQDALLKKFCRVVSELKTESVILDFFKDLINRQERIMLVRRYMVAKMLSEGKTYSEIQNKLRVGSTTISKVDRMLNFGRGGLKKAIKMHE